MQRRYITRRDKVRFTCGSCHQLAKAIVDTMGAGWHLAAFWDDCCDEPDIHAFAETPEGLYLDVEGLHTADKLIERWAMWSVGTINRVDDYDRFFQEWDDGSPYFDSYPRAMELVPELILRFYNDR